MQFLKLTTWWSCKSWGYTWTWRHQEPDTHIEY
jgi:hypothetical protein